MAELKSYSFIERNVQAIQLTEESWGDIVFILATPALEGKLHTLKYQYDESSKTYSITFRYKDWAISQTLEMTDYLVISEVTGLMVKMTKEQFEASYEDYADPALSDGAVLTE
jgi:hypothetical protein